jgi:hypothetical protein
MADVTTDRLVNRIDWNPTLVNALTANNPGSIRIPIHFPTDRECLERIWPTAGRFDPMELEIGWLHNTLELHLMALSETLRAQIEANPTLEVIGGPAEIRFDQEGNLEDFRKILGARTVVRA